MKLNPSAGKQTWLIPFLLVGILLNAGGLFLDILEPDGALYATIAKHMVVHHDWINMIGDGHDWLDKPHLPFWVTALSYSIFGISSFSYKLPAFIFWLIGIRYTWLLAREIYGSQVADIATLVYTICLHSFISNFDVRAEPYLTTLTIGSIYYLVKSQQQKSIAVNIILAAVFAACAVMTKGIFILITIGGGLVLYWLFSKQWKEFIKIKWWVFVLLTFVFITPELYSLYAQFDLYPEKLVFGRNHVSGLKFFFWDSQFGRFFNTGPITGKGSPDFYFHTILWAFLPWSVLLYFFIGRLIIRREKINNPLQWVILGSSLITFLLFTLSSFQLPHYIIIIFPQLSILCGQFLYTSFVEPGRRFTKVIQMIQLVLLLLGIVLVSLLAFYSGAEGWYFWMGAGIVCIVFLFFAERSIHLRRTMLYSFAFATVVYSFLLCSFYPMLLPYQSGMRAGKWLNQQHFTGRLGMYNDFTYSLEFYADAEPERLFNVKDASKFMKDTSAVIYTTMAGVDSLRQSGQRVTILQNFPYYHISQVSGTFLKPTTRQSATTTMVLIKSIP